MKKIIIYCLIIMLFCCVGCGKKNNKNEPKVMNGKLKMVKEELDELKIYEPNIDMKIYDDISKQRQFHIDIISKKKLDCEQVKIFMSKDIDYRYMVEERNDEKLDIDTYIEYIGKSSELSKIKEKNLKKYEEIVNRYETELENMNVEKIFHYRMYITITRIYTDSVINSAKIEYNGKQYEIRLGTIKINKTSKIKIGSEEGIEQITFAASEVFVEKNNEGLEEYKDSEIFNAKENIKIKNIKLYNSSSEIKESIIVIDDKRDTIEQKFTGTPINVTKGASIGISLHIQNKNIVSNYASESKEYILLEYEYKRKDYYLCWEVDFETIQTGYQLYTFNKK